MSSPEKLTDNSIMSFGVHRGKKMKKIPAGWLDWFKSTNEGKVLYGPWSKVFKYATENWDKIQKAVDKEETIRIQRQMLSRRG